MIVLKYINAINYDDSSQHAPLLPPDLMTVSNRLVSFDNINEAREWFNVLCSSDKTYKNTKRKYLPRSYHDKMFNLQHCFIYDRTKMGDVDIKVELSNDIDTYIKIRKAPNNLTNEILKLQLLLNDNNKSNARSKSGDEGKMFALGLKNDQEEFKICDNNPVLTNQIEVVGSERKVWFKSIFNKDYEDHFSFENKLPYTQNSLSDMMVHSIALCNASHYDVDDVSITTSTWVEEVIGNTKNWYLVFPNVSVNGSKGLVIKLFHGCTINWDASKLRHASSKPHYINECRLRGGGQSAGNCELREKLRRAQRI